MTNLLLGLEMLIEPQMILYVLIAATVGLFVGAIPGLNDTNMLALFVSFCAYFDPATGIIIMSAVFAASQLAGSVPAILLNVPGTPSAAASTLEGYYLTKKGMAGQALGCSFTSSLVGGTLGAILSILTAPLLGRFALSFGPPEMFMLAVFGMTAVASLTTKNVFKGLLSAVLGLLVATIGVDPNIGYQRATFGMMELYDGIPQIVALLGLFGVSEMYMLMQKKSISASSGRKAAFSEQIEGIREALRCVKAWVFSSVVGFIIGVIPGTGATIASFTCYGQVRQWSKTPEKFGTGHYEGLVATDAANNAAVPGTIVPVLTLGVPGGGTTVIMLVAFTMHGLQPGPGFFEKFQVEANAIFLTVLFVGIYCSLIGLLTARYLTRITTVPVRMLVPLVCGFCLLGTVVWRNGPLDLWLMLFFSLLAVLFKIYGYSIPGFLLGIVLGPIAEPNFWRAMAMGNNSVSIFFTRPICVALLILSAVSLLVPLLPSVKRNLFPSKGATVKVEEEL